MRNINSRLIWGIVLVLAGVLFLLQNLGYVPLTGYVWSLVFALMGAIFIGVFLRERTSWWAIIPGLTLLGIAVVIALSLMMPNQVGAWIGAVFLGMIGLSFWIVYFVNRAFWWAIIPGGVLLTLALVAGGSPIFGGFAMGGLFFIGLGLTFGLVGMVPTPDGQMKWAFIPAGILLLMGLLIAASATSLANYVWPLLIIGAGVFLVWRTVRYRHS